MIKSSQRPTYRPANFSDTVFIAGLLKEFYAKMEGGGTGIAYHYPSTIDWICNVLTHGHCIVGPSSAAAATFAPFKYNRSVVVAHVEFWNFRNLREITIFQHLIDECRRLGATHIGSSSHYPENRIGRLYEKLGMKRLDRYHIGPIHKMIALEMK